MKELNNLEYVRDLKSNMRASLETEQGKEVMVFLEKLCGWYDFSESDRDQILIQHGGRRILATIKTVLELTPEQVVQIANQKEF